MRRVRPLLPLVAASLLAWWFDAGAIGLGALLGIGVFLALLIGRRPMPWKFGALALAGAVAFGFVVAVLASLYGLSVQDLLASEVPAHRMAQALGVMAVLLAVLGTAALFWGSFFGSQRDGD